MWPDLRLRFRNLEPGSRDDRKLPNRSSIEILTVVGGQPSTMTPKTEYQIVGKVLRQFSFMKIISSKQECLRDKNQRRTTYHWVKWASFPKMWCLWVGLGR